MIILKIEILLLVLLLVFYWYYVTVLTGWSEGWKQNGARQNCGYINWKYKEFHKVSSSSRCGIKFSPLSVTICLICMDDPEWCDLVDVLLILLLIIQTDSPVD